jgi:hypothetical protein
MARIRSIYPSFAHDAKVKRLTRDARLTFLLMLCEADDDGRMPGSGKWLAGTLYEDDEDVTPAKVLRWVGQMVREGMVSPYEVDGAKYLAIVNFKTYQRPKHPTPSKLPPPPGSPETGEPLPESLTRNGGVATGVAHPKRGSLSPPVVVGVGVDVENPSSSSDSRPTPNEPDDDDDGLRSEAPPTADDGLDPATAAALTAAGQARLRCREAEKGQVRDHSAWLAADRRRSLVALARGDRSVLEPPVVGALDRRGNDPLEASASAQRALVERNEARLRGEFECETCSDAGVFESEDGTVSRCDCAKPERKVRAG